jgi:hypothetical protein
MNMCPLTARPGGSWGARGPPLQRPGLPQWLCQLLQPPSPASGHRKVGGGWREPEDPPRRPPGDWCHPTGSPTHVQVGWRLSSRDPGSCWDSGHSPRPWCLSGKWVCDQDPTWVPAGPSLPCTHGERRSPASPTARPWSGQAARTLLWAAESQRSQGVTRPQLGRPRRAAATPFPCHLSQALPGQLGAQGQAGSAAELSVRLTSVSAQVSQTCDTPVPALPTATWGL